MSSIEKALKRAGKDQAIPTLGEEERVGEGRHDTASCSDEQVEVRQPAKEDRPERIVDLQSEALREAGYLMPDMTATRLAEEYRLIKRPLLMNAFGQGAEQVDRGKLIMVSSSLPGEGKSFTSLNLAISMALEMDTTVLLIDADLIKPTLSKRLGLEDETGLTDLLMDPGLALSDVMVKTNMPRLKVLPAGSTEAMSTELLASEQMRMLADELADRYSDRVVIFDSPPILAASQAAVLAHLVGQILMVVEAGRTPQNTLMEALGQLDDNKIIGLMLNKTSHLFNSSLTGDYYGAYNSA